MNVWDVAPLVGIARVAVALIVLASLIAWMTRDRRGELVRRPARRRHVHR
jgi:hypothetical protein